MRSCIKLLLALVLVCLLCLPAIAALPDGNRMEQLGERAAYTAMDQLQFAKGDPDVMVLTNAGRAAVDGQTTECALSGITKISGLQNGDNTLWTVNRAEWKSLWFYFYDKDTGKGLYLVPDTAIYTMSDAQLGTVTYADTFSTNKQVTGDLYQMLADTRIGNETEKALGGEAFSIISITNAWAHGAPYDLMSAAMLHNHLCPGILGGYLPIKYAEKVLPITNSSSSYLYVTTSTSCKEDAFPILWDMTPAKGGAVVASSLSANETAALKAKYGANPTMIIVRWDSRAKSGTGIVLGSVAQNSTEPYTGPDWGAKPYRVVKAMDTISQPELSVKTLRTFSVDPNMYSELRNSTNNPYKMIGDL